MKEVRWPEAAGSSKSLGDRAVLISVHTHYAEMIMSGQKRVELRRRFDTRARGSRMLIYATLPTAAVIGHTLIEDVEYLPVDEIWRRHGIGASICRADFLRYFAGRDTGYAIILTNPTRFMTPIPLEDMRATHGLKPPQSYLYLGEPHRDFIGHEQS